MLGASELTLMADEGIQVTFHRNKQTRSMPSFQTELSFGLAGLVVVLGVAVVVNNHSRGQLLFKSGTTAVSNFSTSNAFGKMLTNHCKLCSFQGASEPSGVLWPEPSAEAEDRQEFAF